MQGMLALVDHHAWPAAFHVAHVTLLGVVYRYAGGGARLAVERGQRGGLVQRRLRDGAPARLHDDMRAGHAARVQPQVAGARLVEGDIFVLAAVLPDDERETVRRAPAQGRATLRST